MGGPYDIHVWYIFLHVRSCRCEDGLSLICLLAIEPVSQDSWTWHFDCLDSFTALQRLGNTYPAILWSSISKFGLGFTTIFMDCVPICIYIYITTCIYIYTICDYMYIYTRDYIIQRFGLSIASNSGTGELQGGSTRLYPGLDWSLPRPGWRNPQKDLWSSSGAASEAADSGPLNTISLWRKSKHLWSFMACISRFITIYI